MSKNLFFILTFLIFSISSAFAQECTAESVLAPINISYSFGKLNYHFDLNQQQITEKAKKFHIVEQGIFAKGLATTNIDFDINIETSANIMGGSKYCIKPTIINIYLGLSSPDIYISNDLAKDTCEYKLVLYHEQTHQQINKKTLEYYLPLFKQSAEAIIKSIDPVTITDLDTIESATIKLTQTYNKKLTPLVNFIKNEILNEQKKLDSKQNYQFESTVCKP